MDRETDGLLSRYSLMDHAVQSDPYDFHALLHERCPVYRMPETGFYVVTRYDDLRKVLKDTATFCVGTSLAKLEMNVAFTVLLDRLERIDQAREMPDSVHRQSLHWLPMQELVIGFDRL